MHDILVIGGGVTGLTAAARAAEAGKRTGLIEAQPLFGGQIANVEALDGYPGHASGIELAMERLEACMENGVAIIEAEVERLSVEGDVHVVGTNAGNQSARAIVLASGAGLKRLDVPGEAEFLGRGVSQCASCDGPLFHGEDVAVVGGGDAAAQEALALTTFCRTVTMICRSTPRAKPQYRDRLAAHDSIAIIENAVVEEIAGSNNVERIRIRKLADGSSADLACAGVFPFIGSVPNSGFLPDTVTREDGYVATGDGFATSVAGIYAAGAVRRGYGGQLIDAVDEAEAAARGAVAFAAQPA